METGILLGVGIFYLALIIVLIISLVKIFQKAGRKGWEAIVPIYNSYVMTKLVGKPGYWVVLMLIPYIGAIWGIWTLNLLVKKFGKDSGFTIGILFLPFIFLPILAFGNAKWLDEDAITESDVLDEAL